MDAKEAIMLAWLGARKGGRASMIHGCCHTEKTDEHDCQGVKSSARR